MKRTNLIAFRRELGLKQGEMASKLGISTAFYKTLEYGTQNPSYLKLVKFEEVLTTLAGEKVNVWELFRKEANEN